ncbi:hypothetical protein Leryth_017584 [Lithospermum erythrorhizon]|nr:hypothetical protein Leryth_017584 [Lithospermum erythrorhizon]
MEFAAALRGSSQNLPECSILVDALEQSACNPEVARALAKSLLRILHLSEEKTGYSFKILDAIPRVLKVACVQVQESRRSRCSSSYAGSSSSETVSGEIIQHWHKSIEASIELFIAYFSGSYDAKSHVLHSSTCIDSLLELFWEDSLRSRMLTYILELMKDCSLSDRNAKLYVCSKYLEAFTHVKEREVNFTDLSIDLLSGMQDTLKSNQKYYQDLFREAECFLHVVSLLNGNLDMENGEKLVLNVLQTLTCLLSGNDVSKASFRALVGKGYLTLRSLLLDFCQGRPSEVLLNALLDMLVDGKFDVKLNTGIKNEDVVLLYLSVLHKSSDSSMHNGLNVFLQLLRDSISNRASCVRSGMLNFLLDWFSQEDNDGVVSKLAQLIQITGGHSISGKDIRKIFALLRSEKVGSQQNYCSLLLNSMLAMLNEKGPTAFIDLNGIDSGVIISTPIQWPLNKGYSFTCWLRVENFPASGPMGLFSFLTENGKGCFAVLAKDKLIYESYYQKRQRISLPVNLTRKKWHFLCLTHTIGRTFSGGSLLRCYLDGGLVSSDKCRYAKVNEPLTICTIGSKVYMSSDEEENTIPSIKDSSPFFGQIGPLYLFNDAITSEQVQGIHSLGPSYMYAFLDNESAIYLEKPLVGGILDSKDGLASKIMFGLNSQASSGRTLFNISPLVDQVSDKNLFEATVLSGSQLCSRRLLQQIIYCVGGVSVFFPLFTQSALYGNGGTEQAGQNLLTSVGREHLAADIIELIASVLDENLANQQQMLLLSGFSVLGFLLQAIPQQLNLETLSALKHLFNVVVNCGLSEKLVQDAISSIFLNPLIWLHTAYKVQRELYMFLIQQFDNDPRLLKNLCRLPRVLDIITEFYCDVMKGNSSIESKLHVNSMSNQGIETPTEEEMHKIRLLLLSLGEMSLRQHILVSDIRALVTFFETNQDMSCIEDVLHMIIRALSQKSLLAPFLEQVNLLGGCHIFVNLLQREFEPIRLLSLQFLGRLLVGLPLEKRGSKFFNIAVGRSKSLSDIHKQISLRLQPIFHLMSDRLFKFPQTEILCATLFDVLLGGASPKQVLQRHNPLNPQRSSRQNSQFFLPHILVLIFKLLAGCEVANMRKKILCDLLDLLDSNPSNIEALMEYGWSAWLSASAKLDVLKNYKGDPGFAGNADLEEQSLVRNLYCVVLSHYILSVRGGWQQLEETVEFLLLQCEEGCISYRLLLRDIYKDLIQKLTDLSSEDNIFISQPCRDNTLYVLKLVDEMLISENDHKLPFPASILDTSDSMELENHRDLASALYEVLQGEANENLTRDQLAQRQPESSDSCEIDSGWWNLYDNLWVIIVEMNGKGSSKMLPRSSSAATPSLGQRARGLVESLNIPAAEMAAVVSGGIGNALVGKPNRPADKAMLLRGEKCPRIVFRLVVLYLCKSSLERACQCIQQVIPLLPYLLTADDEQSKSRLQLFIWSLLTVRSRYGMLDDGARFHVISRLIRETVNSGKSMLANSMVVSNEFPDSGSNDKDSGTIHNLIQKDLVLVAVSDEVKYITAVITDRSKHLQELSHRLDESIAVEHDQKKTFEEEIKSSLNGILATDNTRRASFQLALDEEQQIVAEKWMHTIRSLIDERGPWSANHFPNNIITHWKLDKTEDGWRRRQKLKRNYHFDERLCRPPSALPTNEGLPPSESKSVIGAHIPEQMKRLLLKGIRKITDEGSSETNDSESESNSNNTSTMEYASERPQSEVGRETNDQKDIMHERKDGSSLSTEPEDTEVLMSLPCILVTPKRKIAGRLAVMKTLLHFFAELIVEGSGGTIVFRCFDSSGNFDSSKFDQLEGAEKKKFIRLPISSDLYSERGSVSERTIGVHEKKQHSNIKRHRRWNVCKIKGVQWTRYLLRYSAIEVFFGDSIAPIFLNFSSQKDAKDVGNLIVTTRNDALFPKGYRDKSAFITFIDRRVALEIAETARESWRRRDISNFEYLMILNTLAGRSYNDLTQYPIFPWVLADYSSEVLDFNKSSTFRDLSKPVGALDPKRFEVFEDRYHNFCDPDIPSFYYGSHYSSMGIVLFYLIRLEPFTALHRNLQGKLRRFFKEIE